MKRRREADAIDIGAGKDSASVIIDGIEWVPCACGCNTIIRSVDAYGRPKKFVNGHSRRKYGDPLEYKRVYSRKRYTDPVLKRKEQKKKQAYHHKRKVQLIQLKGGKCTRCPIRYNGRNGAIFQFHHRDPSDKLDRIAFWWSWERVLSEAEKCDLVCSNCHFLIHGGEY